MLTRKPFPRDLCAVASSRVAAVNQAWAGHPGRKVWQGFQPYYDVVAKRLGAGAMAVLIVSKQTAPMSVTFPLTLFGLADADEGSGGVVSYHVRDIWHRRDLPVVNSTYTVDHLAPHDSAFLKFTPAM